jgi:hypothetical protein
VTTALVDPVNRALCPTTQTLRQAADTTTRPKHLTRPEPFGRVRCTWQGCPSTGVSPSRRSLRPDVWAPLLGSEDWGCDGHHASNPKRAVKANPARADDGSVPNAPVWTTPAGDTRDPLTGDEIAAALASINVIDDEAIMALVDAEITAPHMQTIIDLEGTYTCDADDQYTQDLCWAALGEMVAEGMSADEVRAWRTAGFSDHIAEQLRFDISVEHAARIAAADPLLPDVLPDLLPATRSANIPDGELSGWIRAGMLTGGSVSWTRPIDTIRTWRRALGDKAVEYARAGLTLPEACTVHEHGYNADALGLLAALR